MDIRLSYNNWASQYDTNANRTRDLEAIALRTVLASISVGDCLEVGCGTGKNTAWLAQKSKHVISIDLSEEMLAIAGKKITAHNVQFKQVDVLKEWTFSDRFYDLITFSLVLEHIENLEHIFKEAYKLLHAGGKIYIGELHPFKQYAGTKARFETSSGTHVVECFNHHVSDFIQGAKNQGFILADVNEFFDDDNREAVPRILTLLLQKGN
jgi:ubiquinone/menaquinone biosynthesis C-methylase UbiE